MVENSGTRLGNFKAFEDTAMDPEMLKNINILLVDDETEYLNTLTKRLLKRFLQALMKNLSKNRSNCLLILIQN